MSAVAPRVPDPNSRVIELSQRDAYEVLAHGDYKVTTSSPVTNVIGGNGRLAIIDSEKVLSNTIILDNNLLLSMTYSLYDVDYYESKNDDGTGTTYNPKLRYHSGAGNPNLSWYEKDGQGGPGPDFNIHALYYKPSTLTFSRAQMTMTQYVAATTFNCTTGNNPGPVFHAAALAGSFVVSQGMSAAAFESGRVLKIPDEMVFKVRCQYLDTNGNKQEVYLVGNNAAYQELPQGTTGTNPLHLTEWSASSNKFYVTPEGGGTFDYIADTLVMTGVLGQYPGSQSQFKGTGSTPLGPDWTNGIDEPGAPAYCGQNDQNLPIDAASFDFNANPDDNVPVAATDLILYKQTKTFTLPKGRYDPESLAITLSQILNSTDGMIPEIDSNADRLLAPASRFLTLVGEGPVSGGATGDYALRLVDFDDNTTAITFTNDNSYTYGNAAGNFETEYLGADECTLEYGTAGNVFSWRKLHSSLQTAAGPEEVWVMNFQDTATNTDVYYEVDKACGVMLHDLQPGDFWTNTVGLASASLVNLLKDDNGLEYYLPDTVKTTSDFAGRAQFLGRDMATQGFRIPPTIPNYGRMVAQVADGQTNAIIGTVPQEDGDGGYFIVEVRGIPNNNGLLGSNDTIPFASFYVSTQWNSRYITGFSDSGQVFQIPEGTTLEDFHVRILDPQTREVAQLGPENTILLNLQTALPEVSLPPSKSSS